MKAGWEIAVPSAKDVEQGPSIVIPMSFISVVGVYGDLCPNLEQQNSRLIPANDCE
jgi:hypothetical protein